MTIIACIVPEISSVTDRIFCQFGPFFALPLPLTTQKIKIKKWKMKKTPRDIIILHKCTINDNQMMYGSWVMEWNRQKILSFWTIFCPFTPLISQKIKILKNWKKPPGGTISKWMFTSLFRLKNTRVWRNPSFI